MHAADFECLYLFVYNMNFEDCSNLLRGDPMCIPALVSKGTHIWLIRVYVCIHGGHECTSDFCVRCSNDQIFWSEWHDAGCSSSGKAIASAEMAVFSQRRFMLAQPD